MPNITYPAGRRPLDVATTRLAEALYEANIAHSHEHACARAERIRETITLIDATADRREINIAHALDAITDTLVCRSRI